MIVFARSIGFVASTARQDASAEFGMETQPGNCSLFVFRVTASRLGSVSVLSSKSSSSSKSERPSKVHAERAHAAEVPSASP